MNAISTAVMSIPSRAGYIYRSALNACRNRMEHHRVMAEIRQMDNHMLRQFGLNRMQLDMLVF